MWPREIKWVYNNFVRDSQIGSSAMRKKEFPVSVLSLDNLNRDSSNRNIKDRKRIGFRKKMN